MGEAGAYQYEWFIAEYYDFNPLCAARRDVGFYLPSPLADDSPEMVFVAEKQGSLADV